jgi:hypothetical protein
LLFPAYFLLKGDKQMGRLTDNDKYMQELSEHILKREGFYDYFYVDNEGYVTIGIGEMIDAKQDTQAEHNASKFARDNYVNFKTTGGSPVTKAEDVVADWKKVRDYGKDNPGTRAKAYKDVAELRMSREGVKKLLKKKITRHANDMITQRPFMIHVNEQIQMALVDARYNPAGIPIYGKTPADLPKMWDALNKDKPEYDLLQALKYFRNIWKGRGGKNKERYAERHMLRVAMFARGVEAQCPTQPKIDINTL